MRNEAQRVTALSAGEARATDYPAAKKLRQGESMRRLGWMAGLAAGLSMACGGCGPSPTDLFDPQARPPAELPPYFDDQAWAAVLRENVRDGLVDYRRLASHTDPLDAFLSELAFVGPTRTPNFFSDRPGRLAYYLNAYNACVLKVVLREGIPATVHDVHRCNLDYQYRFRVDGGIVTLADLRELARAESDDDARVEFGMCDAARGSPPLAAQPFRPQNLADRLRRLAQEAIDNPSLVRVDHDQQQLLIGLPIWLRQDDFKRTYAKETGSKSTTILTCLMQMASGYRRQYLTRASGYDVRLLAFDRALNIAEHAGGDDEPKSAATSHPSEPH